MAVRTYVVSAHNLQGQTNSTIHLRQKREANFLSVELNVSCFLFHSCKQHLNTASDLMGNMQSFFHMVIFSVQTKISRAYEWRKMLVGKTKQNIL